MKRQISWLICISITSAVVSGQDLSTSLSMAETNLGEGRYQDAEMLYRRVLFFDSSYRYQAETIRGLATISFRNQKFDESSKYYLTLSRITNEPSYYYAHILSLLKDENWVLAKRSALNMQDTSLHVSVSKDIFLALASFGLGDFETSSSFLDKAEEKLGVEVDQKDIFDQVGRVDKKSRTKAIVMSAIVPGSGQLYSKHYGEAANSFLLISAVGLVYYYSLTQIGFLDALISVSPWLNKYYVGGMNRAAELVDIYKSEEFLLLYNNVVDLYGKHIRW